MRRRKNILFLTNRVPYPPNKGDKIRTYHQLDHLAQEHNVYCACFAETRGEQSRAEALRQWCADLAVVRWRRGESLARVVASLPTRTPLSCAAFESSALRKRIARWCGQIQFDAVVAFSAYMAQYALAVPAGRRVLDLCDVDSEKWRDYAAHSPFPVSAFWRAESRRLRRYELAMLDRFDEVLLVTDHERALLDPDGVHPRLRVIPNGVRLPRATPPPPSSSGPIVGFVGAMNYRPNVDGVVHFARRVWPRIRAAAPQALFHIVGRNPAPAVRRLARTPGIVVIGEVESVVQSIADMRVVIAPLAIARGLQNKVLEAMAMRRPVVATPAVGDCLPAEAGREFLVAGGDRSMADRVVDLLRFDRRCDSIGEAGFRFVATHYVWPETLRRYGSAVIGPPAEDASAMPGQPIPQEVESTIERLGPGPQRSPLGTPRGLNRGLVREESLVSAT